MNNDCMVGKRFDKISKIESSFTVECPLFALNCGITVFYFLRYSWGRLEPTFNME